MIKITVNYRNIWDERVWAPFTIIEKKLIYFGQKITLWEKLKIKFDNNLGGEGLKYKFELQLLIFFRLGGDNFFF